MITWDQLAERLAEQLTMLSEGTIVTIGGAGPAVPYVQSQVMQLSDAIWGEFMGDTHLSVTTNTDADPKVMTNVGWQPPGNGEHPGNWWIELPWPVTSAIYRQLATMIVTGFRDYHRIPDPSALSYDAWNDFVGIRHVELELGLPRRNLS